VRREEGREGEGAWRKGRRLRRRGGRRKVRDLRSK